MAVAVVLEFAGGTLDQYDEVCRRMGFAPGGKGEPGGLFHWVTATDGGFRVTDVWEDRETFERFSQEKIGPVTAELGISESPTVTFYDVHNYLTAA